MENEKPDRPENEEKKEAPKIKLSMNMEELTGDSTPPPKEQNEKAETSDNQPGNTEPAEQPTRPTVKLSKPETAPAGDPPQQKKSETQRVNAAEAMPTDSDLPPKRPTIKISKPAAPAKEAPRKSDTQKVDAAEAVATPEPPSKKSETTRIDAEEALQASAQEKAKRQTSRIDLNEVLPSAGKESATAAKGPKTIRLKRPGSAAQPSLDMNKTEEPPVKSQTSRIELPDEAIDRPPTRKKTIKIKRPDGTTVGAEEPTASKKTLSIARSDDQPTEPTLSSFEEPDFDFDEEPDSPGVLFSVMTLAAVLVSAVLIYVLAAQMSSVVQAKEVPSWPYPGRVN